MLNIIAHAIKATILILYVVRAETMSKSDQTEIPPSAHISRTLKVILAWLCMGQVF
jgi:hypothetical protein